MSYKDKVAYGGSPSCMSRVTCMKGWGHMQIRNEMRDDTLKHTATYCNTLQHAET
eukprot:CAMPEP_0173088312 /NCGR_PEP_ID=MMETSP1102-20130122/24835_1 /TAXON_ID=49646 /ORGANISM="Geminigera sp., Strain Caron Lab Isolate" /LENGTH=54 /DNA_ID=CAMNT_0013971143 /DNA_START=134 /DNA_END=294 /DNA_ORIENTATION=+